MTYRPEIYATQGPYDIWKRGPGWFTLQEGAEPNYVGQEFFNAREEQQHG